MDEKYNNKQLESINQNLKTIIETQSNILKFELEQKETNKLFRDDLRNLEHRIYSNENQYILLSKQFEMLTVSINSFDQSLKNINDNQIKLIENLKNNKEKTNTHSKLFFAMLSLNSALLIAVATQFIRKIIG